MTPHKAPKKIYNKEDIFRILSEIPDPEIPVVNIIELGILRDVVVVNNSIEIIITPTYSGCPAMKQLEADIVSKLNGVGLEQFSLKTIYSPPWTTDWISDEAKEKLRSYGIAPPEQTTSDKSVLLGKQKNITCPQCNSKNTEMVSQFGSTACKALYRCIECKEPFDYFKCI